MQLGVMHRIAPDVLSATLAELGGWIRNFLPLMAETEEIHRAVRRVKVGGGGKPAATPRVVLISLSLADETRPFARSMCPNAGADRTAEFCLFGVRHRGHCARRDPARRRLRPGPKLLTRA